MLWELGLSDLRRLLELVNKNESKEAENHFLISSLRANTTQSVVFLYCAD